MSGAPSPVLVEFSDGLPDTSVAKKLVYSGGSFREISDQARREWVLLAPLVQSKEPPPPELIAVGYEEWYAEADAKDRTRMLGYLDMLYEMTLDLAEEEEEE